MNDKNVIVKRLARNNNLLNLEKTALIKKVSELEKEMKFLKKRSLTLETLETNLEIQINKYKDEIKKPMHWDFCVSLKSALDEEKNMINDEEEYV